ncbi:hypothetical protein J0S82_013012, partial [Galemys pyrenaicus]
EASLPTPSQTYERIIEQICSFAYVECWRFCNHMDTGDCLTYLPTWNAKPYQRPQNNNQTGHPKTPFSKPLEATVECAMSVSLSGQHHR